MLGLPLASISRTALWICAAVSIAVVVLGAILIRPRNRLACRNGAPLPISVLGDAPILQVELARNEDDLRAIFMVGDIAQNVRDARAGNLLDSFLFIPGYAGFLLAAGLLLAGADSQPYRVALLVALLAIPIIAICDWVENLGIAHTLDHIEHDHMPHAGDALRISGPSMVKWALLAAVLVIYGLTAAGARMGWLVASFGILQLIVGAAITIQLIRYFRVRFL